jgi:hypothetical protein
LRTQETWQLERSIFEAFQEGLRDLRESVADEGRRAEVRLPAHEDLPDEPVNADILERLEQLRTDVEHEFEGARANLVDALTRLEQRLANVKATWDERFQEEQQRYKELIAQVGETAHGQAAVLAKLEQLREREQALKGLSRRLDKETLPRIRQLQERRDALLTELQGARKSITTKRRKKADQLSSALGRQVSIEVRHAADSRQFMSQLVDLARGSYIRESEISAMAENLHPVRLVKSLLAEDFDAPAEAAGIGSQTFERLMECVLEKAKFDELYELQVVDLEDVVVVRFAVEPQTYRDLEALAHGQKCTVVLMISLAEGNFPLLVDQPEDALHAPWIESYIVSTLRSRRGRRQCLFGTRSANVAVSSDAEQVLALKADANRGMVDRSGAIDRFDTRELLLFHVEGGKEAFKRRQDKYGLDFRG